MVILLELPSQILILGREFELLSSSEPTFSMEYYCPVNPQLNRPSDQRLKAERHGCASVLMPDGRVLIAGGQDEASTEFFDPKAKTFQPGKDMSEKRWYAAAAVLNDLAYICGGSASLLHQALSSCEHLDGTRWTGIRSMNRARGGLAMVALNGCLYAIGGYWWVDGWQPLSSVEHYQPENNSWEFVADMRMARRGLAASVLDRTIYVCGGRGPIDHYFDLANCECYNATTDQWETVAPMKNARSFFPLVTVDSRLCALGGNDDDDLTTVEMYDQENDKWSKLPKPLLTKRGTSTAVVLPDM